MKIRVFLLILVCFIIFAKSVFAQSGYEIKSFDSKVDVQSSGEIKVGETIIANFTDAKHGIYRDIPYVYRDSSGNKTYTTINVGEVLQDGHVAQIDKTANSDYLRIRIGDANKTITGIHEYQIFYTAVGVLAGYDKFDELYWNVTGNAWDTQIASVTATVITPQDSIIQARCYEGVEGSTNECGANILDSAQVKFASTKMLAPYEGLTIATGFKKGVFPIITVARPKTMFEKLTTGASEATFLISLLAGIGTIIYLWLKFGRDSWSPGISGMMGAKSASVKPIGAHEPIIVEYTPPEKLTPALVGLIVDERADTLDVTATIIDLASRGFLTITEIPKKWIFGNTDYKLKQTTKDRKDLLAYEKELLDRIFTKKEILTSELKYTFYDDLAKVKEKLYEEAVNRKYFPENPEKIRNKYLVIGTLILSAGATISIFSTLNDLVYLADIGGAIFVIGVVLTLFSRFMPRRTAAGRELYRRIKGYRIFIERAESYKQKFFENKNTFTDVLPYTIVFGLTEKFAKAMDKIGYKPTNPSWYTGVNTFNAVNFSSNVNSFSSSLSTAIASTPSSSGSGGGGFSGGGFGGGGGGSW